jgi:precorrin-4/cobalt-precorrin-4 C11-methyltransferase
MANAIEGATRRETNSAGSSDLSGRPERGTVYFIGAGPGDPDLITVKGRDLIARCRVCLFAGSLVPRAVVAYAPEGAVVRNTASMNLDEITAMMIEASLAGEDVARVHSGDPSLYGAIAEQIARLDESSTPWRIIPGVGSFQAAAAALGIELTPAGKNQTVILTRAPGKTGGDAHENLAELAAHATGMCLFLSASCPDEVVAALEPAYGAEAPVAIAYRVSSPDERIVWCELKDLPQTLKREQIDRTALLIVGPMLDRTITQTSKLYDPAYSHLFRKAKVMVQSVEGDRT